jgi:hypothetical protein
MLVIDLENRAGLESVYSRYHAARVLDDRPRGTVVSHFIDDAALSR